MDAFLRRWVERIRQRDAETEAKRELCELGLYEWYSLYRPFAWVEHLQDEYGFIDGKRPYRWRQGHRFEVFHRIRKASRPLCGARTRSGGTCKARAVEGRNRCRMHGGASTGPRTASGRARIAESNRRRATMRAEG